MTVAPIEVAPGQLVHPPACINGCCCGIDAAATRPYLTSDSDEFGTPDYIFKPLDEEFHFQIDAAASAYNKKTELCFTKAMNALEIDWTRCAEAQGVPPSFWCNPPYSRGNVEAFVQKAYDESQKGATVVLLLPARTEQPWFHDIVLPHAEVRFIRKRVKFIGGETSARFPSIVAIFPKYRNVSYNLLERQLANLSPEPRIVEPRCVA